MSEQDAIDYLARGWSVVPVKPKGKRPLVRWERFQHEPPDAARIRDWWRRWPDANVAIVTGSLSGLVVLDVDPRHGGSESLAALERQHGALPRTLEASTGGGGRHFYFAHPGGELHNRVGLAPGIDVRGDGGVIVAPPSIHASGRAYAWVKRRGPGDVEPAPPPRWLLALMRGENPGEPLPASHWRALLREGAREGERNSSVASLTGHLLAHGIDPEVAAELLVCWNRDRCTPPLPDDEVVRTVRSIARTHERRARDARGES